VEKPLLPSPEKSSPRPWTRAERVRAGVNSELAECLVSVSFGSGPSGSNGDTRSSISASMTSPTLTRWRRPSSACSARKPYI
jgi:hypothetical protein